MNSKYIFSALVFSILTYLLRLYFLVKKKGLDPTLITYSNPMLIESYLSYRLVLTAIVLLGILDFGFGKYLIFIAMLWLAAQVILLILFERFGTQPVVYYSITISGLILINVYHSALIYIVSIVIFLLQETYLVYWERNKQIIYNCWVSNKVIRLNKKYGYIANSYTSEDWFKILHIAVTESIARPKLSRLIERIYWYIKRPEVISTGIMQIQFSKPMSDAKSMEEGSKIVASYTSSMPRSITKPLDQITWLGEKYNGSKRYSNYMLSTYAGVLKAWQEIK